MSYTGIQDPQAVLDWTIDWSDWLPTGDVISAHTVTAPTGITKNSSSDTDTTVTAWITGGTIGTRYPIVYHITTVNGRQDDRTITLLTQER